MSLSSFAALGWLLLAAYHSWLFFSKRSGSAGIRAVCMLASAIGFAILDQRVRIGAGLVCAGAIGLALEFLLGPQRPFFPSRPQRPLR